MIICGTGHRPNKLLNQYSINDPLPKAIARHLFSVFSKHKVTRVISGAALGFDTILAFTALRDGMPFDLYIPNDNHGSNWPERSRKALDYLLERANEVKIITPGPYTHGVMQKRNEAMVKDADLVVALWNGTRGGTGNCVDYAQKVGKKVHNIWSEIPELGALNGIDS